MRYMVRTGYADDRTNQALLELESALALDAPPLRIEFNVIKEESHGRTIYICGRAYPFP